MAASDSGPTIGRSVALTVYSRATDVAALPGPGTVWQWDAVDVPGGTLQILRDADLVARTEGGWETTRRLAQFMEKRHGMELDAGGQARLDTGTRPGTTESRVETDGSGGQSGRQVALDGEDATDALLEQHRRELMEEATGDDGEDDGERSVAADQATFGAFDE